MMRVGGERKTDFIRLNFLPLTTQDFEFRVYRKEYKGESRDESPEDLYINSLPIDPSGAPKKDSNRKNFWISFEPRDEFQEFICRQDYNCKLTQHFLFHLLLQKIKSPSKENEYLLPHKIFRKVIFFILKEHSQGKETVWLEPYYLQPARKFGFLIDFKFRKNPDAGFSRIVQQLSLSLDKDFKSNRNFYIDKYQRVQEFLDKFRHEIFPLTFDELKIDIATSLENISSQHLNVKEYVVGKGKTAKSQYKGIEGDGPLENVNQEVTFVCIYEEKEKYLLDDLINALRGKSHGILFKGIQDMFNLKAKDQIVSLPILRQSQEDLDNAVKKIESLKQECKESLIMPIFIGYKTDEQTYYDLKYKLLKENLPVQVVTTDLLKRRDGLKWSTSNIALQIFAKLGGKPWKVLPSHERSIIFGIGQAHQKFNGEIVRYFAYSVCTDSSGIYKKINVLGKSQEEGSYLEQLKSNIKNAINEHLDDKYEKCVLHIPFRIKRRELEAINEAIKEIANTESGGDLDFVVLKVNPENKFFGYAYTNSLVPYESSYITLSNNPKAYLVWFEGLQYHRETIHKRIAGPVHIEFYWSNRDFKEEERTKYLQDVLNLSGANWRGFNAKNLPISIYYCQLVANFLKRFPEEVENIEQIPVPWFL